jgi:hypothetical protein
LKISQPFIDPKSGRKSFNRIIPGLNVVVPWPKRQVEFKETKEDRESKAKDPIQYPDTPMNLVTRQTFRTPTLYYPPLPEGIELELHNPYSRYKRQKFAKAEEQMAEWKRRHVPGVREEEQLQKEIQAKDLNIYTPKQLRIRAANKLVKKARKTYFKRKDLTDEDVLLIAGYVKNHLENVVKTLKEKANTKPALTPLEERMTEEERIAHRRKKAILEEQQLEERKNQAAELARMRVLRAKEDKGRNKTFVFKRSTKVPIRTRVKGKKKKRKVVVDDD